jgi:hypothetical protein
MWQVDVVLGIRNEGSQTYNVTMIAGSLNSPAEFKLYVQNFTQIVSCTVQGLSHGLATTPVLVEPDR